MIRKDLICAETAQICHLLGGGGGGGSIEAAHHVSDFCSFSVKLLTCRAFVNTLCAKELFHYLSSGDDYMCINYRAFFFQVCLYKIAMKCITTLWYSSFIEYMYVDVEFKRTTYIKIVEKVRQFQSPMMKNNKTVIIEYFTDDSACGCAKPRGTNCFFFKC